MDRCVARQSEDTADMSNRRAERKEMAVAESRSMSLLTLLEPARNAAGTTQAVYSAVTQPLVVATTEACH